MELIKKIIVILGSILNFIGKLPAFLLPASLKGYRTELFNILAIAIGFLETFDYVGISESICGIFNCDPKSIQAIFVLLITSINIALRRKTDTAPHTAA